MENTKEKEKLLNYILERKKVLEKELNKFNQSNKLIEKRMIPAIEYRLKLTKQEYKDLNAFYGLIEYLELRIQIEPINDVKKAFEEILNQIKVLRSV